MSKNKPDAARAIVHLKGLIRAIELKVDGVNNAPHTATAALERIKQICREALK